jgi:hypothetical protein
MVHGSRGKASHTYDVKKVLEVNLEALTITYTDTAHASPQTVRIRAEISPVAKQVLQAMADNLSVIGDGQWESAYGLSGFSHRAALLVSEALRNGINDFGDEITLAQLRATIEPFDPSFKRTLNKFVGRLLRSHNPNGTALATALTNTTYMVKESRVELYDDSEAEAIKRSAGLVFHEAFKAQRELLKEIGFDTTTREWLRIPAEEIIDIVERRSGHLKGARQPLLNSLRVEQIEWSLLNPEVFGADIKTPTLIGESIPIIGRALYPTVDVLVAALILQCFTEQSGLNLSVMLRSDVSDLIYTGKTNGILNLAKARNHSEDALAVRTGSNKTLGGLMEALSGMTRFSRRWRALHLISDDDVPEVVNRLYVEHRRDVWKSELVKNNRMHYGWRQSSFDKHWQDEALDREKVGLRFQALRRKVLEGAVTKNAKADVHGHTKRTRVHYLANVLPEHVLSRHSEAAQDAIVDAAVKRFAVTSEKGGDAASTLVKAVDSGMTADLITSVCVSAGNDPDEESKPCSLGLAACFTCPNGYRTVDHIPGLLATVRYTEIIRDNDPDEWENGEAALLNFYAVETLAKFPSGVVESLRNDVVIDGHVLTIHHLYTELRR